MYGNFVINQLIIGFKEKITNFTYKNGKNQIFDECFQLEIDSS